MAPAKKKRSLAHGRPTSLAPRRGLASASSAATANIIRTHHRLHKLQAVALAQGDATAADEVQRRIEANGGLDAYQAASVAGQSAARGGDSSKVLIEWLNEGGSADEPVNKAKLRLLEVGALSTSNACSRSGLFSGVTRIDLQARERGIVRQDFMQRPLPTSDDERFHCISLSLVLNYVPEARARGEMLRRTVQFLVSSPRVDQDDRLTEQQTDDQPRLPALFLVLPAPCVTNSRYLDEARLAHIMGSLGYVLARRKLSAKLVYYLWQLHDDCDDNQGRRETFAKTQVNPGKARNNFCIVLEPEDGVT